MAQEEKQHVVFEAGRQFQGEIKTIRRLVKHHVRQLDRVDAWAMRIEQKVDSIERELGKRLDWRQDRHLVMLTLIYVAIFMVTWFFR